MAFLEVEDLEVFYGKACSLHKVSIAVTKGAIIGIIGPNGAGKSTLLDSIIGLTDCHGKLHLTVQICGRWLPPKLCARELPMPRRHAIFFPI